MPNLSTSDMGCWDSLQILISGMFKFRYPSNISYNKARNTLKTKRMVITLNPLGYVNNFDKNRYLEKSSKAAVNNDTIRTKTKLIKHQLCI